MKDFKRKARARLAGLWLLAAVAAVSVSMLLDRLWAGLGGLLLAGTSPAFSSAPFANMTPGSLTAANTATDGTGTTLLVVTGGTNGSFVERIHVEHLGTNVQTVARVFWNNGSSPAVAGNNSLLNSKTIAANTLSQTQEAISYDIPLNIPLKAGERIYVSIGTAVAAGLQFTPIGGDL